ncbi:DUF1800 family protein [Erythrobacter sp. JK5]|uniref:DUF1800 domain-containing protein n=1 Tax=Erythrobacter sp. JK5 TaxID=2829500 RepID=UPI001BAE4FB5|nr:DUF1800 domain-containing protein [Erythrobacter sp. JK5]QUL39169.1 DUF1800 domain-containing protein [Erythrobacter sp. JK5]
MPATIRDAPQRDIAGPASHDRAQQENRKTSMATSQPHIALNRFGYGLRRGESPPDDARRALLRQLDAYDPRPAALAARADTSGEAGELLQLIRSQRRQRQDYLKRMERETEAAMAGPGMADPGMSRSRRQAGRDALPPELRRAFVAGFDVFREDVQLRTDIAVASETPMVERLVHFWSNHFSVSVGKAGTAHQVGNHEFGAIRPHVLGRFSDMLKAAVLHPAMLLYLDQFQSIGPSSRFMMRRRKSARGPRGLNENLAREVLELHTLGVGGGYSQTDVAELARALTGWTIPGLPRTERFAEPQPGGAAFVAVAHEPGDRSVLGRTYRDGGARQALDILDDLAAHPSTARFIATKLARHFAGDDPPQGLVRRLEQDFLATEGDLASLVRALIDAPESWATGPVKYRAPFEWLVSVLRLTGVEGLGARRTVGVLKEIGQVPWQAPSPAGYDDRAGSWAGPDALFRRVELAERIARNVPAGDVAARAEAAFPGTLSETTRTWLDRAESGTQALGLLLVSPEMMRR